MDPNPFAKPLIGMIVPPLEAVVPLEAGRMYPAGVRFAAAGLGLGSLTPEGYDAVIGRVGLAARALADQGAAAVALMGTSLSFYRGAAANRTLIDVMSEATKGLPVTTMSQAVIDALTLLGARRLAVATAYGRAVNDRLASFLTESGFDVLALESLGIEDVAAIPTVTDDDLLPLGRRAAAAAPGADALFMSCGGLRTLDVTPILEDACGLPVVSSAVAGAWGAVRLLGWSGRSEGLGKLLDLDATPPPYARREEKLIRA